MVKNSSSLIYSILFSIISVCLVFFILSLYVRSNATDSNRSLNRSENAQIILKEDHIQSTQSDNLESKDKTLYIFGPGRYHITGSLKDGQIIVDATSEDSITLEFENVTLHNETSAPIWIKQADEVILEFSDGTSNHFSDGATRTESPAGDKIPEACIYARCDLIIHAANSELSIEGNYKEGIHSSDDLSFEQGSIDIQARSTAIKGQHL